MKRLKRAHQPVGPFLLGIRDEVLSTALPAPCPLSTKKVFRQIKVIGRLMRRHELIAESKHFLREARHRLRLPSFRRKLTRTLLWASFWLALAAIYINRFSRVVGISMESTIHENDHFLIERPGSWIFGIRYRDIIVFRYPKDTQVDYIKRVIGLPGDRVSLRCGRVVINGKMTQESFVDRPSADDFAEIMVPAGHYFVLGDNRPVSSDSREWGLVPIDLIHGIARLRYWPLNRLDIF